MNHQLLEFRAWNPETKNILYSYEAPGEGAGQISNFFSAVSLSPNIKVMQFIGMLDKNGKKIYEGDIVTAAWIHHGKPGTPFTAYVFYNTHIGSWRIGYDSLGGGAQDEIYFRYQIEVLACGYEQPDLLKRL